MRKKEKIQQLYKEGLTYHEIAKRVGLSAVSTIFYHLKDSVRIPTKKDVTKMEVGDTIGFGENGKHWVIKRDE